MAKFVFKSNQTIGASPAEQDDYYLEQCFIDTGDLEVLENCKDPRRILIGRTGSGKSALIRQLEKKNENVIILRPESLALTYIANSNVINFFTEAGVKMDIFYRLLWRHIFVVELLKKHFHIEDEARKKSFLTQIWTIVPKKKQHELALEYLKNWGGSFWEETEYRIEEVAKKLEKELQGAVEGSIPGVGKMSLSTARRLTEEQKSEVINRAQEVVKKVQIRELSTVIDFLGEVLMKDHQRRYYIAIDRLDEDWVEEQLRYRLIRALIETSMDFARLGNTKIIVAIRYDLLDRVFRYTRDSGFQEEKYKTSMLQPSWTKNELIDVLDARIQILVKEKYTKTPVTHKDLLPKKVGKESTTEYLVRRTHNRPRDIIHFFNTCISFADGQPRITPKILREAEGTYSRERLRALADEWFGIYPNIMHLVKLLYGKKEIFEIGEIGKEELEENCLELLVSGQGRPGEDSKLMELYTSDSITLESYRESVVQVFYKIGIVGLKTEKNVPISWSDSFGQSVSRAEIKSDTKVAIHPVYWRTLGIIGRSEKDDE